MGTPLLSLPEDTLRQLSLFLIPSELGVLRRCCRALNRWDDRYWCWALRQKLPPSIFCPQQIKMIRMKRKKNTTLSEIPGERRLCDHSCGDKLGDSKTAKDHQRRRMCESGNDMKEIDSNPTGHVDVEHGVEEEEEDRHFVERVFKVMMTCLKIPDYLSLYKCFYRFEMPLLGIWCREPNNISFDFRGGLMRIRVCQDNVVAESLTPKGERTSPSGRIEMRTEGSVCFLSFVNCFDSSMFRLLQDKSRPHCIVFKALGNYNNMIFLQPTYSCPPYSTLQGIDRLCPIIEPRITVSYNDAQQQTDHVALGLYRAKYGPHGLETLFLYASRNNKVELSPLDKGNNLPHGWTLSGLKVQGDANVPAQKVSFQAIIDTEHIHHHAAEEENNTVTAAVFSPPDLAALSLECLAKSNASYELRALQAGVYVSFRDDGNYELIRYDDDRTSTEFITIRPLKNVRAVLNGRGQVNEIVNHWNPCWESLKLVVYQQQSQRINLAFSLIFRLRHNQSTNIDGHVLDFSSIDNVPLHYDWLNDCLDVEDSISSFFDAISWRRCTT